MKMKNKLVIKNELQQIWIYSNNKTGKIAFVSNDENLMKEIEKYTWGYVHNKNTEYFKSGAKPPYYLHQFVMDFYYGKEFRERLTKSGFVIDHLNNNGLDNTIENLHFVTRGENTSKSSLDKQIEKLNYDSTFSMNFRKDFKTGKYLLAILNSYEATTYHFVYNCFEKLKQDIDYALKEFRETKQIRNILYSLNYEKVYIDKHFDRETRIKAIEKIIDNPTHALIEVDGRVIANLDSGQIFDFKPAIKSELLLE